MRETGQATQLRKMRLVATAMLGVMALVLVLARAFQPRFPWLSYLAAFAEAALVGGLADWFAVTALFRHPLGLPLPHTAIIPRNKDRIGESIGHFLQHNFLTHEVLREEVARVDFAGATAHWLADPAHARTLADQISQAIPTLLRTAEDADVASFLRSAMGRGLADVRLAPILAQVLDVLASAGQHHKLLQRILGVVGRALEEHAPLIRAKVHEHSPRWLPRMVDDKIFARLMDGVQSFINELQTNEEWRARFEEATQELIAKLATSDEYEAKLRKLVAQGLGHPLFHEYVGNVWDTVKARLLADLASPESHVKLRIESVLQALGRALRDDPVVRERLNEWLRALVADTIVDRRDVISAVVWRVIRTWDAQTVSHKFELQVGKDLQYIRINGTLVGGLVGLFIHAVSSVW